MMLRSYAGGGWEISRSVVVREVGTSKVLSVRNVVEWGRVLPTTVTHSDSRAPIQWICWSNIADGGSWKMFSMQDPKTGEYYFIEASRRRLILRRGRDPSSESVASDDPRIFIHIRHQHTSTMVLLSAQTRCYMNLNRENSRLILEDRPSGDNNWSLEPS